MAYCASRFRTVRRPTREVRVGGVAVGGSNPIRIQSMTTSDTQDVAATVRQSVALAEVGCEIVRVTAPNVQAARCLREIRSGLTAAGWGSIPLVADIHFLPQAAMEAVEHVEKVDQHLPSLRLGCARRERVPHPAQRDPGRVERLEVRHDARAHAHDARLLERRELAPFVLQVCPERVHRLERPAHAPRSPARPAHDRPELAHLLGDQGHDDVGLSELDGPDDQRLGLDAAHPRSE